MTEGSAFEARLSTAVLGYAGPISSDLDPVAPARRIENSEPRRHGLRGALAIRVATVSRTVWVVLTLATLLLLLVTILVVGWPERPKPVAVPPVGPAFACPAGTDPNKPGPVGQTRPIVGDGLAAMAFDRHTGRIVLLGQFANGTQTWTFDVCTNTWTRMNPVREPTLAEPVQLIYDIDSDATIAIDGQSSWVYGAGTNTWTRKAVTPMVRRWTSMTLAYDPRSGLVIAADASELWSYDVDTDTWAFVAAAPWPAGRAVIAYDASVGRIVAYYRNDEPLRGFQLRLIDLPTRTWSSSRANTPAVVCGMGWPNPWIAYDESAERTVVACGVSFAYDATADRWEALGGSAPRFGDDGFKFSAYDPVNQRFLGLGRTNRDGVLAYDLVTREGIVLLEPSAGQVVPGSG